MYMRSVVQSGKHHIHLIPYGNTNGLSRFIIHKCGSFEEFGNCRALNLFKLDLKSRPWRKWISWRKVGLFIHLLYSSADKHLSLSSVCPCFLTLLPLWSSHSKIIVNLMTGWTCSPSEPEWASYMNFASCSKAGVGRSADRESFPPRLEQRSDGKVISSLTYQLENKRFKQSYNIHMHTKIQTFCHTLSHTQINTLICVPGGWGYLSLLHFTPLNNHLHGT